MSIRKYTIINIGGSIIPMFIMLITVPSYLKILGNVRYGVLALVWLILGYFSFMDMGLGKATANYIARLKDATDRERERIFWTALTVNSGFGILAALVLWITGGYLLTKLLKIPSEFHSEVLGALPWMIAVLPVALVSSVLNGALEGRNRFLAVNVLQISSTVVFQIVPLIAAYFYTPSLSVVIPAAVLSRVLMNIPFLVACYCYVPLSFRPCLSIKTVRLLMSYGGWVAVSGILSPLLETLDRFFIGVVLGAKAVTYYTVPFQLVTKVRIIPASLSRALFPKFSADNPMDANSLAGTSLSALTMLMTPVVIIGIILLRPFMNIWVGSKTAAFASPLGEVLFLGVWANSLANIPYALLQGKGHPEIVAKIQIAIIGPFLVLIWWAINFWGIYGAAVAWTVRTLLGAACLFIVSGMLKRTKHRLGFPILMIFTTLVATYGIADQGWPWRVALGLVMFSWFGIWLKKNYGDEIAKVVFRK